jgi:16S rRNA (uracil1498-N3)-methyltransferase
MPRVFVPPEQLTGERVELAGEAHRHLARVLRIAVGAEVVIFDGRGVEIDGRVVALDGRTVTLALGARRSLPPPPVSITLLQGVPRGERMDLVVQKTTELGVARIVPVLAERSVARPPAQRSGRWQTIAEEAARQSGRAEVPEVSVPLPLAQALALARSCAARWLPWEEERTLPLRRALAATAPTVALLVGPEGGLTLAEVEQARAAGFVTVSMGPRILRTETAAIVAVALIQSAAGGLD